MGRRKQGAVGNKELGRETQSDGQNRMSLQDTSVCTGLEQETSTNQAKQVDIRPSRNDVELGNAQSQTNMGLLTQLEKLLAILQGNQMQVSRQDDQKQNDGQNSRQTQSKGNSLQSVNQQESGRPFVKTIRKKLLAPILKKLKESGAAKKPNVASLKQTAKETPRCSNRLANKPGKGKTVEQQAVELILKKNRSSCRW